jgi:hypothetical protein
VDSAAHCSNVYSWGDLQEYFLKMLAGRELGTGQ